MADRYWVGGGGSWNNTNTTNWSATPGGAGGASVPTAADNVFFDRASTYTVTLSATAGQAICNNITVSAGSVTFATGSLTVAGSLLLNVLVTWTATSTLFFTAATTSTNTVRTSGTSFPCAFSFAGSISASWTLVGALNIPTQAIIVSGGLLDTSAASSYSITTISISVTTANASLNLNNSSITLSGTLPISYSGGTINAGTSTITLTRTTGSATITNSATGVLTLYNVSHTATAHASSLALSGSCTFNNLSITGPSVTSGSSKSLTLTLGTFTINGVLTATTTDPRARIVISTLTAGLQSRLVINSAPNLTNVDFSGILVEGTAAPISGTSIGNRQRNDGIIFSPPKNVYFVSVASASWNGANVWALTPGGAGSTANYPLPQDTAFITNSAPGSGGQLSLSNADNLEVIGSLDMSQRTLPLTVTFSLNLTVFGNWLNGSGVTVSYSSGGLIFAGGFGVVQNILTAGKTMPAFTLNAFEGFVQLLDSYTTVGSGIITLSNGGLVTNGYAVTAGSISYPGGSRNVSLNIRSSTVTVTNSGSSWSMISGITLEATGSTIVFANTGSSVQGSFGGLIYNNISFAVTTTSGVSRTIDGNNNTFNTITINGSTLAAGMTELIFNSSNIVSSLQVGSTSATDRVMIRSSANGSTRTISLSSFGALSDVDFRDIAITGTTVTGTRLGNCGGNSGITFPAGKTVYWNLSGSNNLSATGWAATSGGTPAINNFPLAQDTAVINNSSAGTQLNLNDSFNIGALDCSARTSSFTIASNNSRNTVLYGSFLLASGITLSSGSQGITFAGRGTSTINTAGKTVPFAIAIDAQNGIVVLGGALTSTNSVTYTGGEFDAATYNVTVRAFTSFSGVRTFKMGTGTWTFTGTGTILNMGAGNLTFYPGTANIVLSNSTNNGSQTFSGGGLSFNKLTISGTATSATTVLSAQDTFTELASTKTVAHTLTINANITVGAWTVTGTVGNVVTVNGTSTISISGPGVSGVNYLAFGGTVSLSTLSPGQFWAGANSTGAPTGITLTAAPTPRTLYWVGGTGSWSSTTKWSTGSGGASGAAIPTSLDAVVFDSASSGASYTATIDSAPARCASLTVNGPATGSVTLAGTAALMCHGNVVIASTGVTRTYSGDIYLSGTGSGKTLNSGITLNNNIYIQGVGSSWALGAALTGSSQNNSIILSNGTFSTGGFSVSSFGAFSVTSSANRTTLNLDNSSITLLGTTPFAAGIGAQNIVLNTGTSTVTMTNNTGITISISAIWNDVTINLTGTAGGVVQLLRSNTFNNLTLNGSAIGNAVGVLSLVGDQTITNSFTVNSGSTAPRRAFVRSASMGSITTITAATMTATDTDFRDITIAGGAAGSSVTRGGDCGNNSGIIFPAAKTVYWNLTGSQNWSANAWAPTSGGTPAVENFPLAQDTAVIDNSSGAAPLITLSAAYNTGAIDFSNRTSSCTLTLSSTQIIPCVFKDFKLGTGVTVSGSGTLGFNGSADQTILSNGRGITISLRIEKPAGTVQLGDALLMNSTDGNQIVTMVRGTFDSVTYNTTVRRFNSSTTQSKTVKMGTGTWTVTGINTILDFSSTTVEKGTANIVVTNTNNASTLAFSAGGASLNKLTFAGTNNFTTGLSGTFTEIASTMTVPFTISTTASVTTTAWTAAGSSGALITIAGGSVTNFGYYTFRGSGRVNVDYLSVRYAKFVRSADTWFVGSNSDGHSFAGLSFKSAPPLAGIRGQFLPLIGDILL